PCASSATWPPARSGGASGGNRIDPCDHLDAQRQSTRAGAGTTVEAGGGGTPTCPGAQNGVPTGMWAQLSTWTRVIHRARVPSPGGTVDEPGRRASRVLRSVRPTASAGVPAPGGTTTETAPAGSPTSAGALGSILVR